MTSPPPISGVKYYSLLESSGYGLAALDYILGLLDASVSLYWTPLIATDNGYQPWPRVDRSRQRVRTLLHECLDDEQSIEQLLKCLNPVSDYSTVVMHIVPEYWPWLIEPDKYHVGYTAWETTRLPAHIPPLINQLDAVIVPAHFNEEIFRKSGVNIPISAVPHILHRDSASPQDVVIDLKQQLEIGENDFVFYTINEWSARKAIWSLLEAYLDTFDAGDPAVLVIKTSAQGPREASDPERHDTRRLVETILAEHENPARVKLINEKVDKQHIAALHELGDCFVSTCHSEGWGLGAFEAAGHGRPVMITGWGGQLDYLPAELASLIPFHMVPVMDKLGENSYSKNQQWAEPDAAATRSLLRKIYWDPDTHFARAKLLQREMQRLYAPRVVTRQLLQILTNEQDT